MIKVTLRPNLMYPFQLIIWTLLRYGETKLFEYLFNFKNSLSFTTIMFLAEFFSGLMTFKYQKYFFNKKKVIDKKTSLQLYPIKLIHHGTGLKPVDNQFKIYSLIFFIAISDFVQFMIRTSVVGKFMKISNSLQTRLGAIITLFCAFYYKYVLKLPIFKHQILTLIIISTCLIIILILEFIFQDINIFLSYGNFALALFIIFVDLYFNALMDTIEKYIFEYNFLNPFAVLMFEGLFGFLVSFFFFLVPGYLKDISKVYKESTRGMSILFIILLIVYFILCGGRNIFRVFTNKLYSPMARSLTDYFLNPIYLIFYLTLSNDFSSDGQVKRILYFTFNIILSIIISFCGLIYNEFLVLFFCGLQHETFYQISLRASKSNEFMLYENHNEEPLE